MAYRANVERKHCEACGGALVDLAKARGEATACSRCAAEMLVRPLRTENFALRAMDPNPNGGVVMLGREGQRTSVVPAFPITLWFLLMLFGGTGFAALGWLGIDRRFLWVGIAWLVVTIVVFAWLRRRPRVVSIIDAQRSVYRVEVNGRIAVDVPFGAIRSVRIDEGTGVGTEFVSRDVWLVLDDGAIAVARLELPMAERFAPELARAVGVPVDGASSRE